MKLFSVAEANELLPVIRPKLQEIKARYASLASFRGASQSAAVAANEFGGGGMEGGSSYVRALYDIGKLTTELHELGIQLKDYSRGLIDFPCFREGRVVLLCWQLGEVEQIQWWHEIEDGFAGRQPL